MIKLKYFIQQLFTWIATFLYKMEDQKENREERPANSFVKYSSIGFQMLATIGVFAFIGYKIDEHQQNDKPLITAILSLIGVIVSLYQVVRQLNKK